MVARRPDPQLFRDARICPLANLDLAVSRPIMSMGELIFAGGGAWLES